ncbi:MAG TPA: hypothetical protein VEW72_04400 [Burkholderiales bacterium]|nr:hypothetical protein [Burkholderiales bacterium]
MTRTIRKVPWTIVILLMATLCLFSAMRAPAFAAQTVQAGAAR